MRMMLRAVLDTAKSSEALKSGQIGQMMGQFMEQTKPEAAYFGLSGGKRACYFVFDMTDSSQMPPHLERLFGVLGAEIEFSPIMNADDLKKGMAAIKS